MPERVIGKDFGKPIGQPDTYHVRCGTCRRTEGQFVTATNGLTTGVGMQADQARTRGWQFVSGSWKCPGCQEG